MRFKLCALTLILAIPTHAQSFDPAILRPVGCHPSNIAYYNTPYFANALAQGGEWFGFTGSEFGTPIDFNTPQFESGYPKFLASGQKLRALLFGLNITNPHRPANWPDRARLARGRIVVTWKGNADIRLVNGTFVTEGSSGAATGNLIDGRRIYLCTAPNQSTQSIEIHGIATPLTEIRVWLDGLEGELFHPLFL